MWVGLSLGRSTPRIRGMVRLLSALALLVARVAANDQQLPVPADQLAVFTDPLDARTNLHVRHTPSGDNSRSVWKRLFITVKRRPDRGRARDSLSLPGSAWERIACEAPPRRTATGLTH